MPGFNPNPNLDAVGQGSIWLLQALHGLLNHFAEQKQKQALQKRWEEERPKMEEFLRKGQGIVVWVEYTQSHHKAEADSVITPSPTFVDQHWNPGTRHQKPPDTLRGEGQTAILEKQYIAPPAEAAKQLDEGAIRARLSDLWYKEKTLQRYGEKWADENWLGRKLRGRKQNTLDLSPVYAARAHLSSASTAVKQGRLADAAASMDEADKLLDVMFKNMHAYAGKESF
jgi:hypothetical protein